MKSATVRKPGRPPDHELTARRREQILAAATQLFAQNGYAGTDTQVLADLVQVGKGTLYRYFPSKRDLFLASVDRVMKKLRACVDQSIEGIEDPLQRVAVAIRTYLAFFAEQPEFVELLIQERAQFKDRKKPTYFEYREANIKPWQEMYRSLIDLGRIRDIPVERITDVIGNVVYGAMVTNYFIGQRKSPEAQTRDILDIVFNGILSDSERGRTTPNHNLAGLT